MCVKTTIPYVTNNFNPAERCAYYNRIEPGGSWFPCDETITDIMLQSSESGMGSTTRSQKCCMFNTHWKETFKSAQLTCTNFNAHLYSLNTLNYRQFLKTYASYVVTNFARFKLTQDIFSFWTSCQRVGQRQIGILRAQDLTCYEPTRNSKYFSDSINSHGPTEALSGLFISPIRVSGTSLESTWFNLGVTNKLLASSRISDDFKQMSDRVSGFSRTLCSVNTHNNY